MSKSKVWHCKKCSIPNKLPATSYQSLTCISCDTKHAIVVGDNGRQTFYPFAYQERVKNDAGKYENVPFVPNSPEIIEHEVDENGFSKSFTFENNSN